MTIPKLYWEKLVANKDIQTQTKRLIIRFIRDINNKKKGSNAELNLIGRFRTCLLSLYKTAELNNTSYKSDLETLLLYLAWTHPINQDCPILCAAISDEESFILITGHRLGRVVLLQAIAAKGDYISPMDNLRMHAVDIERLKVMYKRLKSDGILENPIPFFEPRPFYAKLISTLFGFFALPPEPLSSEVEEDFRQDALADIIADC